MRPLQIGLYIGRRKSFELDLRIDTEGTSSVGYISGDIVRLDEAGLRTSKVLSFIATDLERKRTPEFTQYEAKGKFSRRIVENQWITVRIPNVTSDDATQAIAFFKRTKDAKKGAKYVCDWKSESFRQVDVIHDVEEGVIPFVRIPGSNETSERSMTSVMQDAGIRLNVRQGSAPVSAELANGDGWSNSELHNAMVSQQGDFSNQRQWRIWLLSASHHEEAQRYKGIMFDQIGRHRQGCAVFYDRLQGDNADKRQLRTICHELGHCFNLVHSDERSRFRSLSIMTLPHLFIDGTTEYWRQFDFKFHKKELAHLRHAFEKDIIMGGAPFGSSNSDSDPIGSEQTPSDSGLRFKLKTNKSFLLGEPVFVEFHLKAPKKSGLIANQPLSPIDGNVVFFIRPPNGDWIRYRPFIIGFPHSGSENKHSDNHRSVSCEPISYGADGYYFEQVGIYRLKAYYRHCGTAIHSDPITIRIDPPISHTEREFVDRYVSDDLGILMSLFGSDSVHFEKAVARLLEFIEKFPNHRLSDYPRLAIGTNALRNFRTVSRDGKCSLRAKDLNHGRLLLNPLADRLDKNGIKNSPLGQVTLAKTLSQLAMANAEANDRTSAQTAVACLSGLCSSISKKSTRAQMRSQVDQVVLKVNQILD